MSEEAEAIEPTPAAATETPAAPVESAPTFTQEQVSSIVAKEVAIATRKATKAAKAVMAQPTNQEPTTSTGDIASLTETVSNLVGVVKGMSEKQAAAEISQAFTAEIAGLQLSDTDTKMLQSLRVNAPDVFALKLAEFKSVDQPPPATGPGMTPSPGAPSATPNAPDPENPNTWTKDDIASMKKAGTFKENLKKARNSAPGGRGGLFPAKI